MDEIHAMQLFIRIAESESFSHAAGILGLPGDSVSRQIQALENHLNTQLLHRTIRHVQLTQSGMIYYERAKDLLSNLDELNGLFRHNPSSINGRLRVDILISVAKDLVMPRSPSFLYQYPGLGLELGSSSRLVGLIREGFDCVVHMGALKGSGLIARPLGKLTQINCASPQYLARFGYLENLEDLASYAMVHYSVNLGTRARGSKVTTENGMQWVKTGGMLTVNSIETHRVAYFADLGIIQVSRVSVCDALCAGTLVEVLPQYRAKPMPVSLFYPHRCNPSHRVHLFMEWLTDAIKDYADQPISQNAPLSRL